MDSDRAVTNHFLCEYDYGMGAAWAFIEAPSADAIRAEYPALTVYEDRPDYISEARFAEMLAEGGNTRGNLYDEDHWFLVAARLAENRDS